MIVTPDSDCEVVEFKQIKQQHFLREMPNWYYANRKELKESMNRIGEEYNFRIGSALVDNFEDAITWLFSLKKSRPSTADMLKGKSINSRDAKIEPIKATGTIIFVSDAKSNELSLRINEANKVGFFRDKLYFVSLLGFDGNDNNNAEAKIKYELKQHPHQHLVIFSKQIGSRSFSIPQVDNVCIMIGDPSFSSAIQKMFRNMTPDYNRRDEETGNLIEKAARVYWFNLKDLDQNVIPLFEVMHESKKYAARYQFKSEYLHGANIFVEEDDRVMQFNQLPENPYEKYMNETRAPILRIAEECAEKLTDESSEQVDQLIAQIIMNYNCTFKGNQVVGVKTGNKIDDGKSRKGGSRRSGNLTSVDIESKGNKKVKINPSVIRNAVIMAYREHKHPSLANFYLDFTYALNCVLDRNGERLIEDLFKILSSSGIISK